MTRYSDARGRFDTSYERASIYDGIQSELQRTVGQTVDWLVFDEADSERDSIYAVAATETGRQWKRRVRINAFGAFIYQGSSGHNNRGFYNTDTLLVSCTADQIMKTMPDIVTEPDQHVLDRIAYRGKLFVPTTISLLGLLQDFHTVISVEARQINPEEAVNDEQFTANQNPYHVIGSEDDPYITQFTTQSEEESDSLPI